MADLRRSVLEYEGNIKKETNRPIIPHEASSYEEAIRFKRCEKHDWYYPRDGDCEHCRGELKPVNQIPHECKETISFTELDASKGMKFDQDKLRWDLLPIISVEKIVEIITHGAKKYAPENWKKVDVMRFFAAAMRHFTAWKKGEEFDKDSGFTHLAHVGCNILFMMWIEENKVRSYPTKDYTPLKGVTIDRRDQK